MNILITSSSAKVLLVEDFVKAAHECGLKVFTADINKDVASAFFSDGHFVLPRTTDEDFACQLAYVCKDEDIGLIIPTRDGELQLMAQLKTHFASLGVEILVPSEESVRICLDKKEFSEFIAKHGFTPVPQTNDFSLPLFARPISGSAGKGTRKITNDLQLKDALQDKGLMFHPFIDADEYSLDLLMDIDGEKALQVVCRQRMNVVSGESKISKIVSNPLLERWAMEIGELLGLVGHNVLQAFDSKEYGPLMIEANARFGGASNLSVRAGLDSPRRIVKMFIGDESAYKNGRISDGLNMYRYSRDVISL